MRRLPLFVPLALVGVLVLAACGDDGDTGATVTTPAATSPATLTPTSSPLSGEIVVFAAASLTESFTRVGDAFMALYPGTRVTFNFAASSELVAQIDQGAPADVFASADTNNMKKLTDAGNHGNEPVLFASNLLEIIVAPGNPKGITSVADLANPDLIVVTAAPEVPIGKYAADVLAKAGVTVTPKSYEESVRAVVSKVTLGEADAGIVYATDVLAAGDRATGVPIPLDLNVVATYPIVVTKAAPNPEAAAAFVAFVASDEGYELLAGSGFGPPPT